MRFVLAGLLVLLFAQSASAAVSIQCQTEPEPLMTPLSEFQALPVEDAKKRLADVSADIRIFQEGLKVLRSCLQRAGSVIQAKAAEKGGQADPGQMQQLDSLWNGTVEQEIRVVCSYEDLRLSLCARGVQGDCTPKLQDCP